VETTLTAALDSPALGRVEGITSESFDELVRQHQRRVYRVIFLLVRDADAADSLTQECFLRAYQSRKRFRGECRVDTWLLRIAVNLARDHHKNRRISFWKRLVGWSDTEAAEREDAFAAVQPSVERVMLAQEKLAAVWRAVDKLSAQQRTAFLFRFAEEMPLAEIAETLGISTGAVKSHLCRATSKVREIVEEKL
jgi:RNA polymerase sigma-70 factor (ECF subfamily)